MAQGSGFFCLELYIELRAEEHSDFGRELKAGDGYTLKAWLVEQ